MLTKRVIPCLDVKDGRVVKGVNFVGLRDAGDPIELARAYDEQKARRGDLPGHHRHERRPRHHGGAREPRLRPSCTSLYCVGGGFRSVADIRTMIAAGADKVSVNSAAVREPVSSSPDAAAGVRHPGRSSCAIDAKAGARQSPTSGRSTWPVAATNTGIDAVEWAREAARRGAGEILLTSMDRDGSQATASTCHLTRAVARAVDIPVIASGGVGKLEHFAEGIIEGEADAVLAASVFHFGELTVRQVKESMRDAGIPVRL